MSGRPLSAYSWLAVSEHSPECYVPQVILFFLMGGCLPASRFSLLYLIVVRLTCS